MQLVKNLVKYRELLVNLTSREIKARYKQSILGYFWVVLNPFFQMLVMTFVFSTILRAPSYGLPYSVFLYAGLLPWTLFASSLGSATNSLVSNSSLIKKIAMPREIIPIATILAKIVDFFLASTVFIVFMIIYKIPINLNVFWFVPIFIIQILFMTGVSLALSAFNLFYRDIKYLLNLVLTLWMYLSPVVYPVEAMPEKARFVFKINPMAVLINAYRKTILGQGMPNLASLSVALGVSLVVLILGYRVFKKLEGMFADIV